MRHLLMVSVFVAGLFLKVSAAAGADEVQFINNNNNNNNNNNAASSAAAASASAPVVNTVVVPQATYVHPAPPIPATPVGPEVAYGRRHAYASYDEGDASAVLGAREYHYGPRASITPMIGGTIYGGGWKDYVNNTFTLGVAIDIPVSYLVSFEIEGGYARFNRSMQWGGGRAFDLWNIGGDVKLYFTRSVFRPYVGAGLLANYYNGMMFPGAYGQPQTSATIGSGQLLAGAEVALGDGVAIGARGAWIVPMINRPYTYDQPAPTPYGGTPSPGTADASMINTSFYKLLGTVSIAL